MDRHYLPWEAKFHRAVVGEGDSNTLRALNGVVWYLGAQYFPSLLCAEATVIAPRAVQL